jgi:hypothetical protein
VALLEQIKSATGLSTAKMLHNRSRSIGHEEREIQEKFV